MWKNYRIIETIEELTQQLAQQQGTTRIIAAGQTSWLRYAMENGLIWKQF
jgi:hypothetical protein